MTDEVAGVDFAGLQIPPLRLRPSFSSPAISSPANSATPAFVCNPFFRTISQQQLSKC